MRSVIRSYMGMIAIAVVAVLVIGAVGVRIDRAQAPDELTSIDATPAISGNAPNMLVDVQWLQQYQNQVDYIFDLSDIRQYNEGHIPGARHINWLDAMRLHTANYGEPDAISYETNPGDVFGNLHLNVPQNARIVVYDSQSSERASWLVWVMKINGYSDVHVLDGGMQAWLGADGEISTEEVAAPAESIIATPTTNEDVFIRREGVQENLENPDVHIVDTRSAEEQLDTVNGTIREGHIPGAINIPSSEVMRGDGTFKSGDELKALFESYGLSPNDKVIVYSLFSIHSGQVWLALHLAGYDDVQVYQEGFVAWGFNQDLPIETGPFPTAEPVGRPVATPMDEATPASSPEATPEDEDEGPTDLTGVENRPTPTPAS